MRYFMEALRKYAVFSGRSRRAEFWMFGLVSFLLALVAAAVDVALVGANTAAASGPLGAVLTLGLLVPSIAVTVRRLHDVGKSGWMYLLVFVPVIGFIWLLILFIRDGEPGENRFGPNPKEVAAAATD